MEKSASGAGLWGVAGILTLLRLTSGFYFSNYTDILCYLPPAHSFFFFLRGTEAKERGMSDDDLPEPEKSVVNVAEGCADWSEQTSESSGQETPS